MVDDQHEHASTPLLLIGADGRHRPRSLHGLHDEGERRHRAALLGFAGLLLGAISRIFESAYPGIVIQAVTGTVMVAGGMLFVYKIGAIRVTPKFTRIVVGATIGVSG